jgi:hypothetical protein
MTEALLVGIRGAYREKKIELKEKKMNGTGWSGVAGGHSQPNAPVKS